MKYVKFLSNFHKTRAGRFSDVKKLSRTEKRYLQNKLRELLRNFDLNNFNLPQYIHETHEILNLLYSFPVTFREEINDIYNRLINIYNYQGARQLDRERFNLDYEHLVEHIIRTRDDIGMQQILRLDPHIIQQRYNDLRRLAPIYENVSRRLQGTFQNLPGQNKSNRGIINMYIPGADIRLNRDLTEKIGEYLARMTETELDFYNRNLRQNMFGTL